MTKVKSTATIIQEWLDEFNQKYPDESKLTSGQRFTLFTHMISEILNNFEKRIGKIEEKLEQL